MLLFILWSFLTLSSFWFIICVLLNATVRERDPASWHYRFICFCGEDTPPRNSCDYFRKLFFCPCWLLFFYFAISSIALSYLFLDFFWRPFIFGSYSEYKKGRRSYATANPFKRHYWEKVMEHEPRRSYGKKVLPFPPYYLYILAFVVWGFITFVHIPSLFMPWSSDTLHAFYVVAMIVGAIACIITLVALRHKFKAIWEVLTNKLCFDLPLKQDSEQSESQ